MTYTDPDLTWTGNLNPGDTATITFSVTVDSPDTGNHLLASTLTSAAAGQQLPGRRHRPPLHHHRAGLGPGDRLHRQRQPP